MPIKPKHTLSTSDNKGKVTGKIERIFTDRKEFIQAFKKKLLEKISPDTYRILTYYGVGGIGKTTLRKELARILQTEYPDRIWAVIDLDVPTYREQETALFALRNIFAEKYKIRFSFFDLAYTVYWKKTHPQVSFSKENFPLLDGNSFISELMNVIGDLPYIGMPSKITKAIVAGKMEIRNWWTTRGESQLTNLNQLEPTEIEERLPMFFASDLKDYIDKQSKKTIIFIDTYEALWENIKAEGGFFRRDEWIRELITQLPEVLWVICGREKLRWEEVDPDWKNYFEQYAVGKLPDEDANYFLEKCKIENPEIRKIIIEASKGLPHFLDIAVDTHHEILNRFNREPQIEDFAKNQQDVLDRFLRYLDRTEIETLKALSVARMWDRELFELIVKEFRTGYPLTAFNDLCRFSFVNYEENEKYWYMHDLMRESLQNRQDRETVKIIHGFLFNYYSKKLEGVAITTLTDLHKKYFTEAYYHGKSALDMKDLLCWFFLYDDIFINAAQWNFLAVIYDELIPDAETVLGNESTELASLLDNFGIVRHNQGKFSDAEPLYLKALQIREKLYGKCNSDVVLSLNNIGLLYINEGKFSKAEPYCQSAYEICENETCEKSDKLKCNRKVQTINNLALLYSNQGKYKEAEPLYKRAIEISEKTYGQDHQDTAVALSNLAAIYSMGGRYHEAIPLTQRSLEIVQKTLGPEHPDVAESMNNLAVLYDNIDHDEKAEELYKKAIKIREETLGTYHPSLAISLNNLATLYINRKKYDEAETLLNKAIKIYEQDENIDNPHEAYPLIGLASIYKNKGNYEYAEELLIKSLNILKKLLGEKHPEIATPLTKLAILYEEQGAFDKAIDTYRQVEIHIEETLGKLHINRAKVFSKLGELYLKRKNYSEAEETLKVSLEIFEEKSKENEKFILKVLNNLKEIYIINSKTSDLENIDLILKKYNNS